MPWCLATRPFWQTVRNLKKKLLMNSLSKFKMLSREIRTSQNSLTWFPLVLLVIKPSRNRVNPVTRQHQDFNSRNNGINDPLYVRNKSLMQPWKQTTLSQGIVLSFNYIGPAFIWYFFWKEKFSWLPFKNKYKLVG